MDIKIGYFGISKQLNPNQENTKTLNKAGNNILFSTWNNKRWNI